MRTILHRLKREFPFVTQRPATEQDALDYCEREQITLTYRTEIRDGAYIYWPYDDTHHIFLNSNLYGFMLLYVMFHEIGHHMFHVPTRSATVETFDAYRCNRNHQEAESVAAYLLITPNDLKAAVEAGRHNRPCRIGSLIRTRYALFRMNENGQ